MIQFVINLGTRDFASKYAKVFTSSVLNLSGQRASVFFPSSHIETKTIIYFVFCLNKVAILMYLKELNFWVTRRGEKYFHTFQVLHIKYDFFFAQHISSRSTHFLNSLLIMLL